MNTGPPRGGGPHGQGGGRMRPSCLLGVHIQGVLADIVEGGSKHLGQEEEGLLGEKSCKVEDQEDLLDGGGCQENTPRECPCSGTNLLK